MILAPVEAHRDELTLECYERWPLEGDAAICIERHTWLRRRAPRSKMRSARLVRIETRVTTHPVAPATIGQRRQSMNAAFGESTTSYCSARGRDGMRGGSVACDGNDIQRCQEEVALVTSSLRRSLSQCPLLPPRTQGL